MRTRPQREAHNLLLRPFKPTHFIQPVLGVFHSFVMLSSSAISHTVIFATQYGSSMEISTPGNRSQRPDLVPG